MKNERLALLMKECGYRIPLQQVKTTDRTVTYQFPPEFVEVGRESWSRPDPRTKNKRRQIFTHHGGWGTPERIWYSEAEDRAFLQVQLYPDRTPPGPDVQVMVKIGRRPHKRYRIEFLFKAGEEPVIPTPFDFKSPAKQAKQRARRDREENRAELNSLNEKRRYKRTSRRSGEIQC